MTGVRELKTGFELECSTKESAGKKCFQETPATEVRYRRTPNMGIEFAVLARKRFGNKVIDHPMGRLFRQQEPGSINPAFEQALAYDPFIVEIAPSQPVIERLMASGEGNHLGAGRGACSHIYSRTYILNAGIGSQGPVFFEPVACRTNPHPTDF